jgi:hypothetical protein
MKKYLYPVISCGLLYKVLYNFNPTTFYTSFIDFYHTCFNFTFSNSCKVETRMYKNKVCGKGCWIDNL